MKKNIQGTLLISSLLLSTHVMANDEVYQEETKWSVGVGSYAFFITNDDNSDADYEFSGFNVTAGYAFNNHLQVRASYFLLEDDTYPAIDSKGLDLMVYGGVGFAKRGFRGYGGAGFYSDKWSNKYGSESFSGFQFGGGVGYNWGQVGLDFEVKLRQADKYEDLFYESGTYMAMSGNLTVSYLF